ncbi:MAG TPA: isoprenylcysteine carboxylmethyltransferase family protein [Vicinamibacterales bacterium]|nr:isoprenylcysteine carboxylmethyltransferase family protein [Vicinamibacterales bacterium]
MRFLARWRVFLGFVFAAVALYLATPTQATLLVGGAIATAGEMLRLWAAGHLEKSKEVTRSGPYQFTRHPLYLGSSLIGIGFAIAASHIIVAVIVIAYLLLTLTAAMRSEEAHLREKFGDAYDAYAEKRAEPMQRRFSWQRAIYNREHHTIAGLAGGFAILAAKVYLL